MPRSQKLPPRVGSKDIANYSNPSGLVGLEVLFMYDKEELSGLIKAYKNGHYFIQQYENKDGTDDNFLKKYYKIRPTEESAKKIREDEFLKSDESPEITSSSNEGDTVSFSTGDPERKNGIISIKDEEKRKFIIVEIPYGQYYEMNFKDKVAIRVPSLTKDHKVGDYVVYSDGKGDRMVGKITQKEEDRKFYVIDSSVIIPFPTTGGRKTLTRRKKNKKSRKARKSRNKYFFF